MKKDKLGLCHIKEGPTLPFIELINSVTIMDNTICRLFIYEKRSLHIGQS